MIEYDPANWCWVVAGAKQQVYSSKAGDYVPVDDSAYQAWRAAGGEPTSIASEAELGDVLAPYALRPSRPAFSTHTRTARRPGYRARSPRRYPAAIAACVCWRAGKRLVSSRP